MHIYICINVFECETENESVSVCMNEWSEKKEREERTEKGRMRVYSKSSVHSHSFYVYTSDSPKGTSTYLNQVNRFFVALSFMYSCTKRPVLPEKKKMKKNLS